MSVLLGFIVLSLGIHAADEARVRAHVDAQNPPVKIKRLKMADVFYYPNLKKQKSDKAVKAFREAERHRLAAEAERYGYRADPNRPRWGEPHK